MMVCSLSSFIETAFVGFGIGAVVIAGGVAWICTASRCKKRSKS